MLAEASTTEISKEVQPNSFDKNKSVAIKGGKVAAVAREQLENTTGKRIISDKNANQLRIDTK